DKGELERIQETVERDYAKELSDLPAPPSASEVARQKALPAIDCPHCGRTLDRKEYASGSQILIDVCPQCEGMWLDQGEIEALEQLFERAQANVPAVRKGFWATLTRLFPLSQIGTITARFVRKADGQPISGATGQYSVKLYDKDFLWDDKLGEPRLDADG